MSFIFLGDQFVEAKQASLHVSDLAIQRGYGVFDFFCFQKGVAIYGDEHMDRFIRSATFMHLPLPYTREELFNVINELISRNGPSDSGIKMILTGGYSHDSYTPAKPNLIIMQTPLPPKITRSMQVVTRPYQREFPEIKTINYTQGVWQHIKAKEMGVDDVLFHTDEKVTEFPRCNFFIVTQAQTLCTPDQGVLKGITRNKVLKIASETMEVSQTQMTRQEVYQAKEAFMTATTRGILPVTSIDGKLIGDGQAGQTTTYLRDKLAAYEESYIQERKNN